MPPDLGMLMSRRIRLGLTCSALRKPSSPSKAVTTSYPSAMKNFASISTKGRSSSMIRRVCLFGSGRIEHLPHLAGQRQWQKRFADKSRSGRAHQFAGNDRVGVSGSEKDFDAGIKDPDFFRQFSSVHARHDHIGKQKVRLAPVQSAYDLKGIFAIRGFVDLIAVAAQNFSGQFPYRFFVFNQQNGFRALRRALRRLGYRLVIFSSNAGQINVKGRSTAGPAPDINVPAELFDNPERSGQTKARSFAFALGREKGFE